MELLKHCKKIFPDIPTICGGPLSTLVPEDMIVEDCVDIVGRGEAEEQLAELVTTYEKYGNKGWDKLYNINNFWIKDKDYKTNGVVYKNKDSVLKQILSDLYDQRKEYKAMSFEYFEKARLIRKKIN